MLAISVTVRTIRLDVDSSSNGTVASKEGIWLDQTRLISDGKLKTDALSNDSN